MYSTKKENAGADWNIVGDIKSLTCFLTYIGPSGDLSYRAASFEAAMHAGMLKDVRAARGETSRETAEKIDTLKENVIAWERGKVLPTRKRKERVLDYLTNPESIDVGYIPLETRAFYKAVAIGLEITAGQVLNAERNRSKFIETAINEPDFEDRYYQAVESIMEKESYTKDQIEARKKLIKEENK
jgi:transcriptional regulator with XRE-family HTH domain